MRTLDSFAHDAHNTHAKKDKDRQSKTKSITPEQNHNRRNSSKRIDRPNNHLEASLSSFSSLSSL